MTELEKKMTDKPPLWLMDVDGPFNILQSRMPEGSRLFKAGNGFQIMYRPDILKRLAVLHEQGRVELQWLTTWEELADTHLAEEFGLPRGLKVAGTYDGDYRGPHFWWKQNVAQRLYDEGHRIIWTDDAILSAAQFWLSELDPERIIWDAPDELVGITHEFIDRVEVWL